MKKFKTYLYAFAACALAAMAAPACQDDVDAPSDSVPEAIDRPNTTIAELKERYWDEATNYADTIREHNGERVVIAGRVISSDENGNIFKSLIIQDETAAMAFSIDSYNLYQNYRPGQEIVLDVTGMYIGKYAGLQQMGRPSWYTNGKTWQVSFMSKVYFNDHAQLNGMPDASKIDTLVVTNFGQISQSTQDLIRYQSQVVRFCNVHFEEGGKNTFSVYHTSENADQNRTLVDQNGATLTVRTSGYATFCNQKLPEGNIDLVGILSYYNSSWQIMVMDLDGIYKATERPGSKEKPYTVAEAVADIKAGTRADGVWTKGYIVGALQPEVESVTSSSDIQWGAPTVLNTTLVIAPTADCKNISECLLVYLPADSPLRQYGNLRDNKDNLGKQILIKGNLGKYLGTYGINGNSGKADEFEIEGVTIDTGEVPAGNGQEATPFNVAQVIAKGSSVNESSQWVKGYIVGYIPTGGASTTLPYAVFSADGAIASNLVLGPTADCTDPSHCIPVQLVSGSAIRTAVNLLDHPGNLGKLLTIKGNLIKYCGAPGVKEPTDYKLEGAGTPVVPDTPTGKPEGEGTAASPFNTVKALEMTKALAADTPTNTEYYVKGKVSKIKEISTQFGNGTYSITSEGSNVAFDIFRGYYLNGEKFTSESQLKVGDEVVVCGKFVNYKGNTPQMAQGGKLISINSQGGGTTPDPGPVTPDPGPSEPSGDAITVSGNTIGAGGSVAATTTVDGYTISISQESGATAPAANVYNGTTTIRLYADNSITIAGPKMAKIVFNINTATGSKRYTTMTPSTGKIDPAQASGDSNVTWTGSADSVKFTIGHDATLGSDGASKRGQIHLLSVEIYPAK